MAGCRTLHGFITQAGLQHLGDLMFFVPECFGGGDGNFGKSFLDIA